MSPRTSEASPRYLQTFMESMRSLSQSSYLHCVPPRCTVQAVHAAPHTSHIHPTEYDHRFHAWLNLDHPISTCTSFHTHVRHLMYALRCHGHATTRTHPTWMYGCLFRSSKTQSPCHSTSNSITIRLPWHFDSRPPLCRFTRKIDTEYNASSSTIHSWTRTFHITRHSTLTPSSVCTPCPHTFVTTAARPTHMDQTQTVKCFRSYSRPCWTAPIGFYSPYTDEEWTNTLTTVVKSMANHVIALLPEHAEPRIFAGYKKYSKT